MGVSFSNVNNSSSAIPANISKNLSQALNKPVTTVADNKNNEFAATGAITSDKFQQVNNFAPPDVGVVNPPTISNNPEQEVLKQKNSSDTYSKQEDPTAIGLTHEQIKQGFETAKPQKRKFLLAAGAVLVAAVALAKGKSASFFKKAEEQMPIATLDDIVKYKEELVNITQKKITDLKNIEIRLAGKSTDKIKETLEAVHKSAIEMSYCKEANPKIHIYTDSLAENEKKQILKSIQEGKINDLPEEILKKIEFAEVTSEKGTTLKDNNDVLFKVISRDFLDINDAGDVLNKFFKEKTHNLFMLFFG